MISDSNSMKKLFLEEASRNFESPYRLESIDIKKQSPKLFYALFKRNEIELIRVALEEAYEREPTNKIIKALYIKLLISQNKRITNNSAENFLEKIYRSTEMSHNEQIDLLVMLSGCIEDKNHKRSAFPWVVERFRRVRAHEKDCKKNLKIAYKYVYENLNALIDLRCLERSGYVNWLYFRGQMNKRTNIDAAKLAIEKYFNVFFNDDFMVAFMRSNEIMDALEVLAKNLDLWSTPKSCHHAHFLNAMAHSFNLPTIPEETVNMQIARVVSAKTPTDADEIHALKLLTEVIQPKRTTAKLYYPSVCDFPTKPKIALCVSGQLRGWQQSLESWKPFIESAEMDIYLHVWKDVGRRYPNNGITASRTFSGQFLSAFQNLITVVGINKLERCLPSLFALVGTGSEADKFILQSCYGAKQVVIEDESNDQFIKFTNLEKMHYKIWACHQLVVESGEHYDLVIRHRADLPMRLNSDFNWDRYLQEVNTHPTIFAKSGLRYDNGIKIDDQFAIGTMETISIYANTWLDSPKYWKYGYPWKGKFQGHRNLALQCYINSIVVKKALNIEFLPFTSPPTLAPEDIIKALEKDIQSSSEPWVKELLDSATIDYKNLKVNI